MNHTVVGEVVGQGLCIGCGVCAGVCPKNALIIKFNPFGEYNAFQNLSCNSSCGQCLKVCPFFFENDNEDVMARESFAEVPGIKHCKEIGFYLNSYCGYSLQDRHRLKGASGGLATWLIEDLLLQKRVDYAVCVTANNDPKKLFKFQVFNSVEGIRNSSGSVYYPVELSEVINFILGHNATFVLAGLPCFVKAICLAKKQNLMLKKRIRYLIGLVCGQTKSKDYTYFLASMAGVSGNLSKVLFRKKQKNGTGSADNYIFHAENVEGKTGEIFWKDGVRDVWVHRWFTPQSCSYCDDIFAELADVVFMDAWLPEYIKDGKGTNLIVTRDPVIDELIKSSAFKGRMKAEDISIERIIESQKDLLTTKRRQLAYRLFLYNHSKSETTVLKRVKPSSALGFLEKLKVRLISQTQRQINVLFCETKSATHDNSVGYRKNFLKCLNILRFLKIEMKFLSLPGRVCSRMGKIIKGKQ